MVDDIPINQYTIIFDKTEIEELEQLLLDNVYSHDAHLPYNVGVLNNILHKIDNERYESYRRENPGNIGIDQNG